jgi:hypothetical protein
MFSQHSLFFFGQVNTVLFFIKKNNIYRKFNITYNIFISFFLMIFVKVKSPPLYYSAHLSIYFEVVNS